MSANGTSCPDATGTMAGSDGASGVGAGMSNPEQSLSVSVPSPGQTVGGTTAVPAGSAPCPASASGATP
jgi:hypothetical protein